jgi:hypothetical protein
MSERREMEAALEAVLFVSPSRCRGSKLLEVFDEESARRRPGARRGRERYRGARGAG